jgi:predicted amidohydrolase
MKLGIAQAAACPGKQESLDKASEMIEQAGKRGIEFLVFPEMFMAAPEDRAEIPRLAEPLDGDYIRSLSRLARRGNLSLAAGVWEAVSGQERVYNTLVIIDPQGNLAAVYRKLHLFDALSVRESEIMLPGADKPRLVEVCGFQVGMAICYDLRFPELFRHQARLGAELIIVPAAWYSGPYKEEHWVTLLKARALENTVYVAGAGLVGPRFCARSGLVDPFGVLGSAGGEEEEIVEGVLSHGRLERVRSKLPGLQHIRPIF